MSAFEHRVTLGRSGLSVSRLGLGSSFHAPVASYREAFERGVNYFYWGSIRRSYMRDAIREIVASGKRDELVVVLQSYSRSAFLMKHTFERGLRALGIDRADVLLLGWHNSPPAPRILDAAGELVERGRVGSVAVSGHNRPMFATLIDDPRFPIWHVRYNAVHRGAEREVFPVLAERAVDRRPGLVSYTTTRWGHLCDPAKTPPGERTPTGTDCYRFAISHPQVDLALAGPDSAEHMRQALAALDLGPMDEDELAWMRRVGDHIYGKSAATPLMDRV